MKLKNPAELERHQKIQQLLKDRAREFPNESSETRWAAVADSDEGSQLISQMHVANSDEPLVPTQNPRTVKLLLGIEPWRYPLPDSEYKRRYLEKYGSEAGSAYGSPAPVYPSEAETMRKTAAAAGSITDEPKLKEEGRKGFLDEVARLMAIGRNYNQAWTEASSTSPGRELYLQWSRGADQVKAGA